MISKDQIENIQQQLAYAIREDKAVGEAYRETFETYYDAVEAKVSELRQRLESEHAEATAALHAAKEAIQASESRVKALREKAKEMLAAYSENTDPNDKKPAEGFARRDSVVPYLHCSDDSFVIDAARNNYYFLLQPNHKAIAEFVKAFTTETDGGNLLLQKSIREVLPLSATRKYTWTISDTTLLKHAPDNAPDESGDIADGADEDEDNDIPF